MARSTKSRLTLAVIFGILILGLLAWGIYSFNVQQSALREQQEQQQQEQPADLLAGKAATLSVYAYDQAADTPATTKAIVPFYLVESPTVSSREITGAVNVDGDALSSTARTSFTEGLVVGDVVVGLAANGTYYGKPSASKTIDGQSVPLDVNVYAIATSGGDVIIKDKDETTLTVSATGTANLTLGASQEEPLHYMRIENNNTNLAWNVFGFFIDKPAGTNITAFTGSGVTTGHAAVGYSKGGNDLVRVETDDEIFYFNEPIMLLEYDYIQLNDLAVKADGDGCAADDTFTIYVFDANWFRSSKKVALMLGAETDADSPADVGAGDYSETYACTA